MENNTVGPQSNNRNYKMLLNIFAIILGMGIVLGVSYAIFRTTDVGKKKNVITTGDFGLEINDVSSDGISVTNALPMTFDEGIKQTPYTFTLTNTGDYAIDYKLSLENLVEVTEERMPTTTIRYLLIQGDNVDVTTKTNEDTKLMSQAVEEVVTDEDNNEKTVYYIETGIIGARSSQKYTLYLWIDYDATAEIQGTKFKVRARVDGEAAKIKKFIEPTEEQLAEMKVDSEGAIYFVGDNTNIEIWYAEYVSDEISFKTIVVYNDSVGAYQMFNKDVKFEEGRDFIGGIWYFIDDNDSKTRYTGECPFDKNDLTDIYSEEYLDYIISLF